MAKLSGARISDTKDYTSIDRVLSIRIATKLDLTASLVARTDVHHITFPFGSACHVAPKHLSYEFRGITNTTQTSDT
jgi:hypothetical protein